MKGFEVLIEREFLSFGYPFKTRSGNCQENAMNKKNYAPVFLLFLDCIYQAMIQAPLAFEFNQKLLKKLAIHSQTLKFGTFLNDSEAERAADNTYLNTISIWNYLEHYNKVQKYRNELYDKDNTSACIGVNPLSSKLLVWKPFHFRWFLAIAVPTEEYPNDM
eukprot:TRINITY_DN13179_c0_g1_i6.p2 TRINITY_DN13179_c0_g1~~TRINITY_DN13179_c0_g1_i6.p2  ORF type:complete len:162 (+),score=27.63 TRINITY_DN13179_c0_g1_i6:716-1201(+)